MWWAHLDAFYNHDAFAKDPIEAVELLLKGWEYFNRNEPASIDFLKTLIISGDISVKEVDYGMCICDTGRDLIHLEDVKIICTDRPMFIPLVERLKKEMDKYDETD